MDEKRKQQSERDKYLKGIVRKSINAVMQAHPDLQPRVVERVVYGAVYIDPKHLAIWLMFEDFAAVQQANANGTAATLKAALLEELAKQGYPTQALPLIHIGFEDNAAASEAGYWNYFR